MSLWDEFNKQEKSVRDHIISSYCIPPECIEKAIDPEVPPNCIRMEGKEFFHLPTGRRYIISGQPRIGKTLATTHHVAKEFLSGRQAFPASICIDEKDLTLYDWIELAQWVSQRLELELHQEKIKRTMEANHACKIFLELVTHVVWLEEFFRMLRDRAGITPRHLMMFGASMNIYGHVDDDSAHKRRLTLVALSKVIHEMWGAK